MLPKHTYLYTSREVHFARFSATCCSQVKETIKYKGVSNDVTMFWLRLANISRTFYMCTHAHIVTSSLSQQAKTLIYLAWVCLPCLSQDL